MLRSYDELPTWQNYLRDNPRRLMMKRARPDWLRPFFNLRKGDQQYNGIGNRELLNTPSVCLFGCRAEWLAAIWKGVRGILKEQEGNSPRCHQPSRQARKGYARSFQRRTAHNRVIGKRLYPIVEASWGAV